MKKLIAIILTLLLLCGCSQEEKQETPVPQSELEVYFLDVGQADSIFIRVGDKNMLIDGGNVGDGKSIISFLHSKDVTKIDTVVATHAHEDHIGGLSTVIDHFAVSTVYTPTDKYDSVAFNEFLDAADRQCGITLCEKGMSWQLNDAHFTVLWPENPESQHTNNTSIVLKMTFGKISFLFTGDVEKDAEALFTSPEIKSDILKVAHHGSDTSTGYLFLRDASPDIAVISCGTGNSYGHPHDETLNILQQADVTVLRTDLMGTILITSDGETYKIETEESLLPTPVLYYIGNKNSLKFHLPTCNSLPSQKNAVILSTRKDAIDKGYTPCQGCKP